MLKVSAGDLTGSFAVWVETLLPVKQSDVEALHRVCSPLTSVFMAIGTGDAQLESKVNTNRALQCEERVEPAQECLLFNIKDVVFMKQARCFLFLICFA